MFSYKFNKPKYSTTAIENAVKESKDRATSDKIKADIEDRRRKIILLNKGFDPNYLVPDDTIERKKYILKDQVNKIIEKEKQTVEEERLKNQVKILNVTFQLENNTIKHKKDDAGFELTPNMMYFIRNGRVFQKTSNLYTEQYEIDLYRLFSYVTSFDNAKPLTKAQKIISQNGKKNLEDLPELYKYSEDSEYSEDESFESDVSRPGEGLHFNKNDIISALKIGHDNKSILHNILKSLK